MAIDIGDDFETYMRRLPDPSQLVTPEAILDALRELEAEEARIDDELAASMADRDSLETLLERIDSVRPVVEQVQLEAAELARRVEDTALVAERISGKVRQLDLEQSRVSDSIQMVQAVQDLKTSLAALAVSVDKKDWETATRNMQRAMSVDKEVTSSAFAEAVVPTGELPQAPTQAIQDFRDVLLSTFLREFAKASSERDEVNTSRYFKLFPMIAAETEGLDAYATFVCSIVNSRTQTIAGQASSSTTYFAAALSPLFEQIALIVSQHQPVVEKYYGQGRMLPVAVRLQQECDQQAGDVLRRWEEERTTLRKLNEVQRWRYPHLATLNQLNNQTATPQQQGLAQVAAVAARKLPYQQLARQATASPAPPQQEEEETIDPKEIDGLLTEMSLMSGRWALYRRFLYGRLRQAPPQPSSNLLLASPALHGSPDTSSLAITGVANGQSSALLPGYSATNTEADEELEMVEKSTFQASLHRQLASVYEPLETWYLRSSIEKAHHLDEADLYNKPYLSSALDDSFFILKKVLQRLVATASLPTFQRMCNEITNILARDFSEILRQRMDSVWSAIQSTAQAARSKEEASARQQFIVYANDLDTAADYLTRVVDEIVDGDALKQAFFRPSEFQIAIAALVEVKNTQDRFRATLKTSLDQLFNQLIRPRLRSMLGDCYRDVTYVLDEDGYSDAEYQDAVRKRFLKFWDGLVDPYKDSFTSSNYQSIFTLIIGVLSRLWEIQLKSMKFTELGALRFERDLRNITAFLSNQTAFGVSVLRDSFSRLQQMAKLLSIESPSDADDLAASSGWKLSQQEMVNLLNLRT